MRKIKVFLSLILIAVSSATIYSGTIDPKNNDKQYIEYGSKYDCIVQICGEYNNSERFCASAVVIDEHHILTAAHVVADVKNCYLQIENKKYNLNKVIIHKNFEKEFGIGDIAIGYSIDKIMIKYYPKLYDKGDEVGKKCSIAGYGLTGTFNTGAIKSDNLRRAGTNTVDRIYKDLLICSPSRVSSGMNTNLEFLIASGDSGGGLFIDNKLAGINSCIMSSNRTPSSKYDEESGHTRISQVIDWIETNKTK